MQVCVQASKVVTNLAMIFIVYLEHQIINLILM